VSVAVTGANGFVGDALVRRLAAVGRPVIAIGRRQGLAYPGVTWRTAAAIEGLDRAGWSDLLAGAEAVVHCAGIAHIGKGVPAETYRAVNLEATERLSEAAAAQGIGRFVFLSSIRAQSGPSAEGVLSEDTPARPTDDYGRTKLEAERAVIRAIPAAVILRPVLVAGPGAKGNLAQLLAAAATGLPLPFDGFRGRRSVVSLASLTGAIRHALSVPAIAPGRYIVADDGALTLGDMLREMRRELGKPERVFAVPAGLIRAPLRALGRGDAAERLSDDLLADAAKLKATGWRPATTAIQAIRMVAAARA
jgi:UDP-glucose 4-epimerase